ncbi:hypothetical protein MRX96_059595 [Rhipicephalus microplus]
MSPSNPLEKRGFGGSEGFSAGAPKGPRLNKFRVGARVLRRRPRWWLVEPFAFSHVVPASASQSRQFYVTILLSLRFASSDLWGVSSPLDSPRAASTFMELDRASTLLRFRARLGAGARLRRHLRQRFVEMQIKFESSSIPVGLAPARVVIELRVPSILRGSDRYSPCYKSNPARVCASL